MRSTNLYKVNNKEDGSIVELFVRKAVHDKASSNLKLIPALQQIIFKIDSGVVYILIIKVSGTKMSISIPLHMYNNIFCA